MTDTNTNIDTDTDVDTDTSANANANADALDTDSQVSSIDHDPLAVDEVAALTTRIFDNVERVIVGHRDAAEDILITMLARGHLLLEDVPGVGKTMLARSIATSLECSFNRVQFTPDLLPPDVTGVNVFDQQQQVFEFQPGPVFANVVLGDEINRAPPKTQAALLEVMAEQQVTVDGETHAVPDPFTVIATQNDIEPTQTYDLPVAEVDRFTKQIRLGYPNETEEAELLGRVAGHHPIESLEAVATVEDLNRARETVAATTVSESVRSYVAQLAGYTRDNARLGVSPRGAIALVRLAQARAVFEGRDFVIPDDIHAEIHAAWSHRIQTADTVESARIVDDALDEVPVE